MFFQDAFRDLIYLGIMLIFGWFGQPFGMQWGPKWQLRSPKGHRKVSFSALCTRLCPNLGPSRSSDRFWCTLGRHSGRLWWFWGRVLMNHAACTPPPPHVEVERSVTHIPHVMSEAPTHSLYSKLQIKGFQHWPYHLIYKIERSARVARARSSSIYIYIYVAVSILWGHIWKIWKYEQWKYENMKNDK